MMQDRDRAELRLILAKHKLLFLRPKYREEQMIEEVKGMFRLLLYKAQICYTNDDFDQKSLDLEAKEIYKSIKERCRKDDIAFGSEAGAMINLMWEKRIESSKCKPVRFYTVLNNVD